MLSNQQKRQFVDEGYIVVPGAVPGVMVEAARRAVNHSIGHVGVGGEDLAKHRAYEAYFKEHGHAVLAEGRPPIELPVEPVMVTARAGDLVVAHHALMHGAGRDLAVEACGCRAVGDGCLFGYMEGVVGGAGSSGERTGLARRSVVVVVFMRQIGHFGV